MQEDEGEYRGFSLGGFLNKNRVKQFLDRQFQFFNDIAVIREKNSDVADNLESSFFSKMSAVFSESEIIARKVRHGHVEVLSVSPASSDAYYIQNKENGIYVRLEIKSVLRENAAAINQEIMNAEAQHKARLPDEKGRPTWHKTRILIGDETNPWPFSTAEQYEKYKNVEERVLEEAAKSILKCQAGAIDPNKALKATLSEDTKAALRDVEQWYDQALAKHQTLQEKGSVDNTSTLSSSTTETDTSEATDESLSEGESTQYRQGGFFSSPEKDMTRVKSKNMTPGTKLTRQRTRGLLRAVEKSEVRKENDDERLASKLLVTERITVDFPHRNCSYVLDRTDDLLFHVTIKPFKKDQGSEKKSKQDKPLRRQWRNVGGGTRRQLHAVDEKNNSALHLAVRDLSVQEVQYYVSEMASRPNDDGKYPIHELAKIVCSNNAAHQIVELLGNQETGIDLPDSDGNTVLHLACFNENVPMVRLLISLDAGLDDVNADGESARDIINKSANEALQQCLDNAPKNTL